MQADDQGRSPRRGWGLAGVLVLSVTAVAEDPAPFPGQGEIQTIATVAADGGWARVDLVDGGVPAGDPGAGAAPNPAKRAFLEQLTSFALDPQTGAYESAGLDLDGDLADADGDGVPDTGFDRYTVGLAPLAGAGREARIIGANNLYDLFQTSLGAPDADVLADGFGGFTGGDVDGDGQGDGGPGLFANAVGSGYPHLPTLPHVMGSGRGGQRGEQHQFLQVVFPYDVEPDSVFSPFQTTNSFLDHTVRVLARWVERQDGGVVDMSHEQRHVSGVAILGGVCAVPVVLGGTQLCVVDPADPALSGIPVGARSRVFEPNVLTFIAHEHPGGLPDNPPGHPQGWIDAAGILRLPDPELPAVGGRVFGANHDVPDAVNDFGETGDQLAARIGFISFEITTLRTTTGVPVEQPYFHGFEVSQAGVGADPAATGRGFTRGPAVAVDVTGLPAIEVDGDPDALDARPLFLVRFDKEVVPDSVGFSRRHTRHGVPGQGLVFPFNGNTAPVPSPAPLLVPGSRAAPLAPSLYLAVNQAEVQVAVNNPFFKDADHDGLKDDGAPIAAAFDPELPGLHPQGANAHATLPRAVVPCDVFPLNQNNLQAYVVQPLVDLPADSVVTLGVCLQGLGTTHLRLTNRGNFTHAGTLFSAEQGLDAVGLPRPPGAAHGALLPNQTIVKVNAGPMDLSGRLFEGSTAVALDTLIDGDAGNDATTGGVNVARTFRVAESAGEPRVNAPVAPEALCAAYTAGGAGVVDLNGRGLGTNAPAGSLINPEQPWSDATSRHDGCGQPNDIEPNWKPGVGGQPAFGFESLDVTALCIGGVRSVESELGLGRALPLGPLTHAPGINEGSSGPGTFVRNSHGQTVLSAADVGVVQDVVVGQFLDARWFDETNPWAITGLHRAGPWETAVAQNAISDPPVPNPPPLGVPLGLPYTFVGFDQSRLDQPPTLIEGYEVFSSDGAMIYDHGAGPIGRWLTDALIQVVAQGQPAGLVPPPHAKGFHQTGPARRRALDAGRLLARMAQQGVTADLGAIQGPTYSSRQQTGNLLFVSDRTHGVVHALNSNTLAVIGSVELPDPYGLGISPDLSRLWVSNRSDDSVSVVSADPRDATFLQELARIPVAPGPTAVAAAPDGEDVFVLHTQADAVSILDAQGQFVRKTLDSPLLDEPTDICLGMRETPGLPGFESGSYHGFIANAGGDDVLVFESGPAGVFGIGFDDVIGAVSTADMRRPTRVVFDPVAPLDAGAHTVGCFVLHEDAAGEAVVSRIAYTADASPGVDVVDTSVTPPGFHGKTFEVIDRYATGLPGPGLDLVLPDFDREAVLRGEPYNLGPLPPLPKAPVAFLPGGGVAPRWKPAQLWVSVAAGGLQAFDIASGAVVRSVPADDDVAVLASWFAQ